MDNGLRKGYLAQELRPEELSAPVWEFCQSSPAFQEADPGALSRCAAMSAKPADAGFQQAALAIVFRGRVAQPAGVPFSI